MIYAPLQEYLNMLGVRSSLQTLPKSFSINGQEAPLSLLATGPDRYTGKDIYYINVTATVDYMKADISYNIFKQGSSIRIAIDKIAKPVPSSTPVPPTPVATPVPKLGSITGRVDLPQNYKSAIVRLIPLNYPVDNARAYYPASYFGDFIFDNLKEGEYRIEAECEYKEKGPLQKSQSGDKPFYFELKKYRKTWSRISKVLSGKETNEFFSSQSGMENCYQAETIYLNSESEYYNYQVF
jgi:hypothetical protein